MRNLLILITVLIINITLAFAQHTNVMISNTRYPNEPSIALDPKNPQHIVAGANLNNYYISTDGGYTWSSDTMSSTYGVWGDPMIFVDTMSSFYFIHLSAPLGYHDTSWLDRIVCQKMDTIGSAWSNGSYTTVNGTKDQDKAWAAVDPRNNNIYLTWTQFDLYGSTNTNDSSHIMFSKSTDAGHTWTLPRHIDHHGGDCHDSDSTVEGAVPAVGPDGEVYVAWAGPPGIVFNRSLDEGASWLDHDIFINDMPGGWDFSIPGIYRCNGMPVTCCDRSNGPYRGTIYVNWSDQRNGTYDTDIWLSKSTDGGNTWSAPNRINDDPPGKQQFFTWMTIDQATGYLYCVFYDRRNYNDNRTDVYMAVSKNGGNNFVNFCVSDSSFDPYSTVFFGDYTNITAYNNIVRPIWTRLNNEKLSILTAIIDTNFLGVDNNTPFKIPEADMYQNYPNPFRESTFISFKLAASTPVTLKIFDLNGREIATLINNELLPSGKYVQHFDAALKGLNAGVYYFKLIRGDKIMVRKMIVD